MTMFACEACGTEHAAQNARARDGKTLYWCVRCQEWTAMRPGEAMLPECVDASDLGWTPGVWPPAVERLGAIWRRGAFERRDGELTHVVYRADDGRVLHVVND